MICLKVPYKTAIKVLLGYSHLKAWLWLKDPLYHVSFGLASKQMMTKIWEGKGRERDIIVFYNLISKVICHYFWLFLLLHGSWLLMYGRRLHNGITVRNWESLGPILEFSQSHCCLRSLVTCQVHTVNVWGRSHLNPLTLNSFLPQHSAFTHLGATSTSLNNLAFLYNDAD